MEDSLSRIEKLTDKLTKLREQVVDEYEFFWNHTHALLVVADPEYWIKVNPAACTAFGYKEDDLVLTSWKDMLHPEDRQRAIMRSAKIMKDGFSNKPHISRFKRKDGMYAAVRWTDTCFSGEYFFAIGEHVGNGL